MVSIITGREVQQEASQKAQTFDLVKWARACTLQWYYGWGDRLLKRTVFEMLKNPQDDATETTGELDRVSSSHETIKSLN